MSHQPHPDRPLDPARRASLRLLGLGGAALLAGCSTTETMIKPGAARAAAQASTTIGAGPVTAALLVPLSSGGGGGAVGTAIRNACDMAMAEFVHGEFQLVVKDDLGTPEGASAAATAALAEGAHIVLGPLFAPAVRAAGAVVRSGGVPMIAFSSDASVAAPGIYLLSFMPQSDVERIVAYAAASGKTSFAALIPETAYGTVVQGEFQQAASRHNVRIAAMESFGLDRAAMQAPVARVAEVIKAGQADALFLPEGGDALPLVAAALGGAGISPRRVQLLGTGVWDDKRVFAEPLLQGGLYAAPDASGFQAFAGRYRARFGTDPVRLASVGYDAVSLIAGLLKAYGAQAFDAANLTNPSGFSGIDGAFRFRTDGTNERSLSVLRVTPQGGQTVSAAARSFVS